MLFNKEKKVAIVLVPRCGSITLLSTSNQYGFRYTAGVPIENNEAHLIHLTYESCVKKYKNLENYEVYGFFRNPLERFLSAMAFFGCKNFKNFNEIEDSILFRQQTYWLGNPKINPLDFNKYDTEIKRLLGLGDEIEISKLNSSANKLEVTDEIKQFVYKKYANDYEFGRSKGLIL